MTPRTDGAFSFPLYHLALHCGAFSFLESL